MGHRAANTALQPFGGVRMPSRPQDGYKRAYNAKQVPSRSWSRMGTVTSKAILPFLDTSAFCVQLQLVKLLLMELAHCCLR